MKKRIKIFIITIIVIICLISIPFNFINLLKNVYYINIDEDDAKLVNSLINDNNLIEKPIKKIGYMAGLGDWYLFIEYEDGEKREILYDDNDNLVGYDVEVSRALAKELGVKVKFVEVKWDSLIAGLDSDKYDLVTNQVAITAERKKKYDFSIPHTYSYPAIITKKDNTEITKMSDIKGHKFSQTGSSNFSKIVEKYKGEIVATNDWNENVSLVEQGRVDGTVNDTLAYYDLVNKKPDTDLKIAAQGKEVSEQAFIFNKGQDDLKKNVDKALKSLKKSGKLAEISNKYFKTDVSHK